MLDTYYSHLGQKKIIQHLKIYAKAKKFLSYKRKLAKENIFNEYEMI